MVQTYSTKPVNNFIKGLITEASVMTYPDGASSDELNCDLLKNGARQRRRGIEFEENYVASSFTAGSGAFIHTQNWQNVSGIGGTEFLVVQVNSRVYFYDKSYSTLSLSEKPFSINLLDYKAENEFDTATSPISVSSSIGYLVIVSQAINPIRVVYNSNDNTISVSKIKIEIRDFEYLNMSSDIDSIVRTSNTVTITTLNKHALEAGDTIKIDCNLSQFNGEFLVKTVTSNRVFTFTLSGSNYSLDDSITGTVTKVIPNDFVPKDSNGGITKNYQYDLFNMGWAERVTFVGSPKEPTPYEQYLVEEDFYGYPPRNKPWYFGKLYVEQTSPPEKGIKFNASEFYTTASGNTLSPNGFFILDFFNQDRSKATEYTPVTIGNLPVVNESSRFSCTASYAGRVWYAGLNSSKNGGKIFFSKVVENKDDFGKCYQMASPTAEDTAGVVDSDGGYIIIPDISDIKALFPTGSVLYVLASNGVWAIGGVDQVFKATEYYVSKISNFGIINSRTLSNVSGTPIYWGVSGIFAITVENNSPTVTSISDNIKTFYDNIGNSAKKNATSVFDRLSNRIYWMYSSETETIANKKNKILVLDMSLQAFFPWTVSDKASNTPYIVDGVFLSGLGAEDAVINIVAGTAENQVIDATSNIVVKTVDVSSAVPTEIKFLTSIYVSGVRKLTFATFTNRDFLDWDTANYSSYAETGYDFQGSATVKKNAPYITTYLKRTEENFIASGAGYEADYPSSCTLIVKWDLSGDNSRWSTPSQVYRILNYPTADPGDLTFDYPYDTIVCRTKIRGKGRVLRLKFESEQGKDFYLIGWEMISASNPRY